MTRKQINSQFEQHTALLHKLSHLYANRCGRPEKDVFQQACYLFMQATEGFIPERGVKFVTYLYPCVQNGLIDWGKKNDLPPDPVTIPDQMALTPTPDKALMMKEWIEDLSDECREVAMIILNGPAEVLDIPLTAGKKIIMGALRRHLRETKDWSWPHIWNVLRETKRSVASLSLK